MKINVIVKIKLIFKYLTIILNNMSQGNKGFKNISVGEWLILIIVQRKNGSLVSSTSSPDQQQVCQQI